MHCNALLLCYDCCQAAGDCITPNDCAMCAKKVVALLQSYESQLQRERQRLLEEEQRQQREQERREEAERERIRQEKRAAKVGTPAQQCWPDQALSAFHIQEKRREEARMREVEVRKEADMKQSHEMQVREVYSQLHSRSINIICPG